MENLPRDQFVSCLRMVWDSDAVLVIKGPRHESNNVFAFCHCTLLDTLCIPLLAAMYTTIIKPLLLCILYWITLSWEGQGSAFSVYWLLASFLYSAIISETQSKNTVRSGPIPQEVVKTSGWRKIFSLTWLNMYSLHTNLSFLSHDLYRSYLAS